VRLVGAWESDRHQSPLVIAQEDLAHGIDVLEELLISVSA
jgi:hypothetical protein